MKRSPLSSGARAGMSLLPALALLGPLLLGACAPGGGGAAASPVATSTVDLPRSYKFEPAAITVPAGTTVTWTNSDTFTHNVRLEGAEPMQMAPGQSVTHAFDAPGTYPYVCTLHSTDMQGSVLVTAT